MATGGAWDVNGIYDINAMYQNTITVLKSCGQDRDVVSKVTGGIKQNNQTIHIIDLTHVRDPQALYDWCVNTWGPPGDFWGYTVFYSEELIETSSTIWLKSDDELTVWHLTWDN